jgi:hypothetical protein
LLVAKSRSVIILGECDIVHLPDGNALSDPQYGGYPRHINGSGQAAILLPLLCDFPGVMNAFVVNNRLQLSL